MPSRTPPPTSDQPAVAPAQALTWNWSGALLGAVDALPAAAVMADDVSRGLAFAVGVIPAAVVGVQPSRRRRPLVIVVGMLAGLSIFVGGVLSNAPWIAVPAIFLMAVGTAALAQRRRVGQFVLVLSLPLVGVGLSYADLETAAGLGLIMAGGSIYACVVSLLWPQHDPPPPHAFPIGVPLLGYGIRLGLAASIAAAIGFGLDLDHVGWACAATLLVMRPSTDMVELRSVGRIVSVVVGAALAVLVADQTSDPAVYAVLAVTVIAAASATRASRWYVTPAFTTVLALSLLVYADPDQGGARFVERTGETALGIGLAYFFGLLVPEATRRYRGSRHRTDHR